MVKYSTKFSEKKFNKKVGNVTSHLYDGEELVFFGPCVKAFSMVNYVAVTTMRILLLNEGQVKDSVLVGEIKSVSGDSRAKKITIIQESGDSFSLSVPSAEDCEAVKSALFNGVQSHCRSGDSFARVAADERRRAEAEQGIWESAVVKGKLSKAASKAIYRQCSHGEAPWFILSPGAGMGVLAAFENRLVIIKTGLVPGFMAGSLGGERASIFYFSQITGVEYNSGMMTGVLEVLTASYDGSANKDYWRGVLSSRNADSNSPWTLSNCLPLPKMEYSAALPHLDELRERISKASTPTVVVEVPEGRATPAASTLADEIKQLGELVEAGVLSPEEFAQAKAKLIGG